MCRSQRSPIGLGIGIAVQQLVEELFCLLIPSYTYQCSAHQFLEVITIVIGYPHHPLISLVEDGVVEKKVAHVLDEFFDFVGRGLYEEWPQILVGFLRVALGNHDFRYQIVVVRRFFVINRVSKMLGLFIVAVE